MALTPKLVMGNAPTSIGTIYTVPANTVAKVFVLGFYLANGQNVSVYLNTSGSSQNIDFLTNSSGATKFMTIGEQWLLPAGTLVQVAAIASGIEYSLNVIEMT